MARLTWNNEDGVEQSLALRHTTSIGRLPDRDVQLRIRGVSRMHARVRQRPDGWWVEDAGSTNGTWKDGRRLDSPAPLRDGDTFTVETVEFVFRLEGPGDEATTSIELNSEQVDSAVRARVRHLSGAFRPAGDVEDVDRLREDYEKLRIANELSRQLAAEFDVPRLLDRILEQAFRMFRADRGAILLMNAEGQLRPAASRVRGEEEAAPFRLSSTILREALEERTAVLSSDAMTDGRFQQAQSIMLQGIRATMCVPLISGEHVHGVIALDSRFRGEVFTGQDLHLLTGFAMQAATLLEHVRLLEQRERDLLAREQMGRLLPPEMVDAVVNGRVEIRPGGTIASATVLFADIRGFTGLSENLSAPEVVDLLNDYFDRMVEVVFALGGTLDKFIGDELMAVWGAPIARPGHCAEAVEAALRMQEAVHGLNAERSGGGLAPVEVGIGLNTGELLAGFIGSRQAMNWTVIGDVVNVASRLCGLASAGEVLASDAVLASLPDGVEARERETRRLRGRRGDTRVVELRRA